MAQITRSIVTSKLQDLKQTSTRILLGLTVACIFSSDRIRRFRASFGPLVHTRLDLAIFEPSCIATECYIEGHCCPISLPSPGGATPNTYPFQSDKVVFEPRCTR